MLRFSLKIMILLVIRTTTRTGEQVLYTKFDKSASSLATLDPGPHNECVYPIYMTSVGTSSTNGPGKTSRDVSIPCELLPRS